jgi:hypothetical protein
VRHDSTQASDRIIIRLASPPVRYSCRCPHPFSDSESSTLQKCWSNPPRYATGRLALLQVRQRTRKPLTQHLLTLVSIPTQRYLHPHPHLDSHDPISQSISPKHHRPVCFISVASSNYLLNGRIVLCASQPDSNYGTADSHPPAPRSALSIHYAYCCAPQPHGHDDVTHYTPPQALLPQPHHHRVG